MTQSTPLRPTLNDLPEATRRSAIALLQARLTDALDLEAQTKQAHWNVRGRTFSELHQLFDWVHGEVEEHVDTLAERITALGGVADGRVQTTASCSGLSVYPLEVPRGDAHVELIAGALAHFGASIRSSIDAATRLGDMGTADLFTEISRSLDKQLWLVEAQRAD
ncbi:MAG: DNA starvation/stationary phase protection protein Dps [Polyangiaceae bacterium]|nr:DNA starvation/stationary phase protection protein Dps [Polyangiaceae bacterium]